MTNGTDGLQLRPISRGKPVDVETRCAAPDRREDSPAAGNDARAAHDRVAHQHRARGRARNRVHFGGVGGPGGCALGKAFLAQNRGGQLDYDVNSTADVETFVVFGEPMEVFVIQPEDRDRLGMMDDPGPGYVSAKVDPDEEDQ